MNYICEHCGVMMQITNLACGKSFKCPKCGIKFSVADGAKEYKFLTQKDLCGSADSFDVKKAEAILNQFACKGWRVVSATSTAKGDWSWAGSSNPAVLVLERDLPRAD